MKRNTLPLFVLAIVVLVACSKDKFATTPKVEVKDYNSKEIPAPPSGFESFMTIRLNYFDKEGDLGQGQFYAERVRKNKKPLGSGDYSRPTFYTYALPEFVNRDKGEITFQLSYNDLKQSRTENDTLQFRIAVSDRAGNKSDTITTDAIVILN